MATTDIQFESSGKTLRAALSTPSSVTRAPGVVIIHEAFGLDEDIRSIADRFADHGLIALAPDLYSSGFTPRCLVSAFRGFLARQGEVFGHIDASRSWLAQHHQCTGQIGVAGFCLGGGFALLCASRNGFAASSVNYGLVPKSDLENLLGGSCPIVASFGARDRALRGAADRLETALTTLGVEHDIKEYPNAGHSFLNQHSGWKAALGRVFGVRLDPDAADDAWERIFTFFNRQLMRA